MAPPRQRANEHHSGDISFERPFKPRNPRQTEIMEIVSSHMMTILRGAAGTGKTHLAVSRALLDLADRKMKRDRILAVRAAHQLDAVGFLSGDLDEKMGPFMEPIIDIMEEQIGEQTTQSMLDSGRLEIRPVTFAQGRTIKNGVILLEEAQNASIEEAYIVLTRAGDNTRVIVTLDPRQRAGMKSDSFATIVDKFKDRRDIAVVDLGPADIVRSRLTRTIVEVFGEL